MCNWGSKFFPSCAGLTRASIFFARLFEEDGLPVKPGNDAGTTVT
jgi:hypothetical protein